jgi:hypothetical protein
MGLRDRGWVAGGEAHPIRRSLTEHSHYVAQTSSVAATRGEDRGMQSGSGSEPDFVRDDVAEADTRHTKQCVRGLLHHAAANCTISGDEEGMYTHDSRTNPWPARQ